VIAFDENQKNILLFMDIRHSFLLDKFLKSNNCDLSRPLQKTIDIYI